MAVVPNGRPAVTGYRVKERFERWTLLELDLITGRTHQIRVHLASIGYPVAGDPVYATGAARRGPAGPGAAVPALVADRVRVAGDGELVRAEAALPDELEQRAGRAAGDGTVIRHVRPAVADHHLGPVAHRQDDCGQHPRRALRDPEHQDRRGVPRSRTGIDTSKFVTRDPDIDREMDELQSAMIRTATPAAPFILEGRLAAFLASEERALRPLPVATILFWAPERVRMQRQLRKVRREHPAAGRRSRNCSRASGNGRLATWPSGSWSIPNSTTATSSIPS